jgi:hypothetical protein
VFAHLWNKELDIYGREWVNPLIDVLPAYHRLGFLDVFTHGVFVGSSTDPKNRTKNICCNYEYRFADEFGGNAVMKKVIDAAHARGMRVWHWFGLQFDQDSRLWREHPDWILREVSGDPWDSGYRTLQCGRLRSGYGKYLLDAINRIKDETGLDNIFWDSYQNMGAICVDWHAPDKAPQIEELWRFQADLQRHGYVDQRCETATIFGIANVQVYAFDDEIEGSVGLYRRKWSTLVENDEAFAWLDASPGFFSDRPFTRDRFSPDKYFWMAAHRALPCFDARPWGPEHKGAPLPGPYLPGQELAEEYGRVNWLYLAALPFMHRLRVTEGGRYALWLDAANAPSVLWVFQDVEFGFSGIVVDLESKVACGSGRTKSLKAGRVYLLHLTADGMAGRLAELSEFP